MRVISTAPTQTEIIAALGFTPAGVTIDCDFPKEVAELPKFGSWYAPDFHRIIAAKPDLVCTFGKQQEEIGKAIVDAGYEVYHSDPGSVGASLRDIRNLAEILHRRERGEILLESLENRLERVRTKLGRLRPPDRPGVFRIMHWEPLITVGPGSFQHDVIGLAGGLNIFADGPSPYFVCNARTAQSRNPDSIFFCEPQIRACLKKSTRWDQVNAVRYEHIHTFDCGLTCRSGPRIVTMVEELARVLHPEIYGNHI